MVLSREEAIRILSWVYTCDAETALDLGDDWGLIERLASFTQTDPGRAAPCLDRERREEAAGLFRALDEFESQHGRFPGVDEQMAIRDRLGL